MARSDIEGDKIGPRAASARAACGATLLIVSSCNEIRHVSTARRCAIVALALAACTRSPERAPAAPRDTVVVFTAASLGRPIGAALDSFARRTGAVVRQESGASIELARRITELHRVPDLIALADHEVFPELLVPGVTSWYARGTRVLCTE